MASGKIELEIGGKYGASQMFAQAQDDVKKFGRAHKDAMDAGKSVANELAGVFEGRLSGSFKTAYNLLADIGRGGLWGAMSSIASATIGYVVGKFKELSEAAEKAKEAITAVFRKDIKDAADASAESFKKSSDAIADAKKEAADALDTLNGKVAETAAGKAVEIKLAALGKASVELDAASTALANGMKETSVTMSAAQKAVADADTKYALAMNAATATVEKAKNTRDAAEKAAGEATAATAKAETYLEEQVRHRAEMETTCSEYLDRRKELQDVIANAETLYKDGTITLEQSNKMELQAKSALIKLEEEYKDDIAALSAADKAVADAQKAVETARKEEAEASRAAQRAGSAVTAAEDSLALVEAEGEVERKKANLALQKERHELDERQKEEEKAKQAAKEKAEADIRLAEESKARAEAEKAAREAAAKGREAATNAVNAIKELGSEIKEIRASTSRGMRADAEHTNGVFGPYQYSVDENGNIDNFIDFQRSKRFAERGARDDQRAARRDDAWESRMEKLQRKDASQLTDSERRKLADWDDYKKQKTEESELDRAINKIVGADNKSLSDLYDTIDSAVKDLGLK